MINNKNELKYNAACERRIEMILEYMDGDKLSTRIEADLKTRTVRIVNYTDKLISRAFGVIENPTWTNFEEFLESRCMPRTRDKLKWQLRELNLDRYDPLLICKKTQGRMADDDMWIRFVED